MNLTGSERVETIEKTLKDYLKDNRLRGTRLLQKLVQEDSTRGNESSAQAVIVEKCRQLGLHVDIWGNWRNKTGIP